MTAEQSLATSVATIIGEEYIAIEPNLEVDGICPQLVARPGSLEEVAACMRLCSESGASVVPAGLMTWLESGNPLKRADLILSLDRLRRIIDYSPPDLTATVEAGLPLAEFNEVTNRERQWLPLDPPGYNKASLGAIAACNSSGALRLGFGVPRDYVIGLKLVHPDGSATKSGGKVAKNVAGYDMNKLYVGSYGTLAIITQVTLKLRPLPDCTSTIAITSRFRGTLFQLAKRILASELQPSSVILCHGLSGQRTSTQSDDALLVRFIDSEAAVRHQVAWVNSAIDDEYSLTVLSEDESDSVWSAVANFDSHSVRTKLSVPLSDVPVVFEKAFLAHLDCIATADVGTGIIRIGFDAEVGSAAGKITALRSVAAMHRGSLVIERAPVNVRRDADAWGDVGSTAELMRSIKASFDPQSLLNPGKFVLGL